MYMNEKTNPNLSALIDELKMVSRENDAPVWKYIGTLLEKPERNWAEVNVGKLQDYAKKNVTVVVPREGARRRRPEDTNYRGSVQTISISETQNRGCRRSAHNISRAYIEEPEGYGNPHHEMI